MNQKLHKTNRGSEISNCIRNEIERKRNVQLFANIHKFRINPIKCANLNAKKNKNEQTKQNRCKFKCIKYGK